MDIHLAGYEPANHRKFLIDYYTGNYSDSHARGVPFGHNEKTGDARISGSLASLVGLQYALEEGNLESTQNAIKTIILLHSMILSFGGIPLIYYGDETGTLNDSSYLDDPHKSGDSRWVNRPRLDWEKAKLRNSPGSVEYQIFSALKRMIAVRKETAAFADFNNRELIDTNNPHLFVFERYNLNQQGGRVLVVANFDSKSQHLNLSDVAGWASHQHGRLIDLYTGQNPDLFKNTLIIPINFFDGLIEFGVPLENFFEVRHAPFHSLFTQILKADSGMARSQNPVLDSDFAFRRNKLSD